MFWSSWLTRSRFSELRSEVRLRHSLWCIHARRRWKFGSTVISALPGLLRRRRACSLSQRSTISKTPRCLHMRDVHVASTGTRTPNYGNVHRLRLRTSIWKVEVWLRSNRLSCAGGFRDLEGSKTMLNVAIALQKACLLSNTAQVWLPEDAWDFEDGFTVRLQARL